jgi:chromosomal replication initiator protein
MIVPGIHDRYKTESSPKITDEVIVRVVCAYFCVTPIALKTKCRTREVTLPRQLAMWLIRKHTTSSYKEIGEFFGRDHSTVIYAKQTVDDQSSVDILIQNHIRHLEVQIYESAPRIRNSNNDRPTA